MFEPEKKYDPLNNLFRVVDGIFCQLNITKRPVTIMMVHNDVSPLLLFIVGSLLIAPPISFVTYLSHVLKQESCVACEKHGVKVSVRSIY